MSKPESPSAHPDIELACEAAWKLARLIGSLRLMVRPNRLGRPTSALRDRAGLVLEMLDEGIARHGPPIMKVREKIAREEPVRFAGGPGTSLPDAILRRAYSLREELETALFSTHLDNHYDVTPDQPYNPSWRTMSAEAQPVSLEDLWAEGSWDAMAAVFAAMPKIDVKDVQVRLECLLSVLPAERPRGASAGARADTLTDTPKKKRKRPRTGPRNKKELAELNRAITKGRRDGDSAKATALAFVEEEYPDIQDPEARRKKAEALLRQRRGRKKQ